MNRITIENKETNPYIYIIYIGENLLNCHENNVILRKICPKTNFILKCDLDMFLRDSLVQYINPKTMCNCPTMVWYFWKAEVKIFITLINFIFMMVITGCLIPLGQNHVTRWG